MTIGKDRIALRTRLVGVIEDGLNAGGVWDESCRVIELETEFLMGDDYGLDPDSVRPGVRAKVANDNSLPGPRVPNAAWKFFAGPYRDHVRECDNRLHFQMTHRPSSKARDEVEHWELYRA